MDFQEMQMFGRKRKYESVSLLEGCVLENSDGNRLTVRKDNNIADFYLHAPFGALLLTREPCEKEDVLCYRNEKKIDPFAAFRGRELSNIDKLYMSLDDRMEDMPWMVYMSSHGHPGCLRITGGDGVICIDELPSNRYIIRRVSDIIERQEWSDDDVHFLKLVEKVIRFPVFDEDALRQIPELYSKMRA